MSHPLFANSKRYPALLAYVVEQTLLGNAAELKERSIGIEVFGRAPSYDANADPVVRITAGEVRKRLSQYYYDSSHEGELGRSSSPSAPMCPSFTRSRAGRRTGRSDRARAGCPSRLAPSQPLRRSSAVSAAGHASTSAGWLVAGSSHRRFVVPRRSSVGHRHPILTPPPVRLPSSTASGNPSSPAPTRPPSVSANRPRISTPTPSTTSKPPSASREPEKLYVRLHYSGNLALADVVTLTRAAAALETRHKTFRVVPASEATFAQLREGPIVLIGAFDNIWTLRVTQKLRFGFESKDGVATLVDRKSPQNDLLGHRVGSALREARRATTPSSRASTTAPPASPSSSPPASPKKAPKPPAKSSTTPSISTRCSPRLLPTGKRRTWKP